jgi:hypothetical protein
MGSHEDTVRTLEAELAQVEQAFRGLTDEQWATPTKLRPLDEAKPHWTLFELAGHFDISIGLTVMLVAEPQTGQVGRDRVSFFIFPRSEVAPVVYDYAYTMVEGKTPAQMPDVLAATFTKTIEGGRSMAPARSAPATTLSCGWTSSWPAGWWRRWSTASTSPTRSAASPWPPPRGSP